MKHIPAFAVSGGIFNRAVDKQCNTVEFLLSEHRDVAAANAWIQEVRECRSQYQGD